MFRLFAFSLILLASFAFKRASWNIASANEQLIVVFDEQKDLQFKDQTLPKLIEFASEKNIELNIRKVEDGLPENITTSPVILYQNALGRALYAGRYTAFSTIKNFIRTSKLMPQKKVELCKENILTSTLGRSTILAPFKLTPLEGAVPKEWDQSAFEQSAKQAIAKGMKRFSIQNRACIEKSDRQFYMDVYPYRTKDGVLYLSLALFSQFNCITPIYTTESAPLYGSLEMMDALFESVGKRFEEELFRQIELSKIGDAFNPVPAETPMQTWEELGFPLPERSGSTMDLSKTANQEIPETWTFYQALEPDLPVLQFHFMEPLDRYAGEVKNVKGTLQFNTNKQLERGGFEVETQSLTMGSVDFDAKILKKYIKAYKYPDSSFEFDALKNVAALEWGTPTQVRVSGKFRLMKYTKPLVIEAQLTPILDENGKALLEVRASFELNITDNFNITGPDGPDPARKMMVFNTNFLMQAVK